MNVSSSEGIPVSIMEATSFGIPGIATDAGGTKEIIRDKENGVLLSYRM
ncbi:MAG: glycosyltransferase [Blautia massiliensis (ex Durand et al. 2017)]